MRHVASQQSPGSTQPGHPAVQRASWDASNCSYGSHHWRLLRHVAGILHAVRGTGRQRGQSTPGRSAALARRVPVLARLRKLYRQSNPLHMTLNDLEWPSPTLKNLETWPCVLLVNPVYYEAKRHFCNYEWPWVHACYKLIPSFT